MGTTAIYALITPVRNEEKYIGKTIDSVLSQTLKPIKWVIVSDRSTDNTDKIVKTKIVDKDWIDFIRIDDENERDFSRKVYCFNIGYKHLKNAKYDVIGNLDGDVSFDNKYFEYLMQKFEKDPCLGVAGTPYIEKGYHSFRNSFVNIYHVHGQIQMFRKYCFESIGGYSPIKIGGIDWVAVTSARMKGWKTKSFQGKHFIHHKKMGTGGNGNLRAIYNYGKKDYYLGNHPMWELLRCGFQMKRKPYILGGLLLFSGFILPAIRKDKKLVTDELMRFHRLEQVQRLKGLFSKYQDVKRN